MDPVWVFAIVFGLCIIFGPILYTTWNEIPRSCKNAAFKEYKARVKQNLEAEEQEFIEYLSESHMAADRAVFEQFKASKK